MDSYRQGYIKALIDVKNYQKSIKKSKESYHD